MYFKKKRLILFLCLLLPCLSNCSGSRLFDAIDKNDFEAVKKNLNSSNINEMNAKGLTPLMESIINNNFEITQYFISNGADVNKQSIEIKNVKHIKPSPVFKQTPLMLACQTGNMKSVELLINNKADVNIKDSIGETALFYLCRNNDDNLEILKILIDNKADITIKGVYFKKTAAEIAIIKNNKKIAEFLIKKGGK